LRYISSLDIFAQEVTMSTEDQSWVVTHDCNLYMSNSSEVSVRPAHKTHMLPHRMNRLGTWDSLVITVDGRKKHLQSERYRQIGYPINRRAIIMRGIAPQTISATFLATSAN